eukprot:m.115309 g.115309  ORF g.115309 m.115309 type:complete len:910 (-) comp9289_c0_seq1:303-3032(-)
MDSCRTVLSVFESTTMKKNGDNKQSPSYVPSHDLPLSHFLQSSIVTKYTNDDIINNNNTMVKHPQLVLQKNASKNASNRNRDGSSSSSSPSFCNTNYSKISSCTNSNNKCKIEATIQHPCESQPPLSFSKNECTNFNEKDISTTLCDQNDMALVSAFRPATSLYHTLRHRWNQSSPPFLQRNLQYRHQASKLYNMQLRKRYDRLSPTKSTDNMLHCCCCCCCTSDDDNDDKKNSSTGWQKVKAATTVTATRHTCPSFTSSICSSLGYELNKKSGSKNKSFLVIDNIGHPMNTNIATDGPALAGMTDVLEVASTPIALVVFKKCDYSSLRKWDGQFVHISILPESDSKTTAGLKDKGDGYENQVVTLLKPNEPFVINIKLSCRKHLGDGAVNGVRKMFTFTSGPVHLPYQHPHSSASLPETQGKPRWQPLSVWLRCNEWEETNTSQQGENVAKRAKKVEKMAVVHVVLQFCISPLSISRKSMFETKSYLQRLLLLDRGEGRTITTQRSLVRIVEPYERGKKGVQSECLCNPIGSSARQMHSLWGCPCVSKFERAENAMCAGHLFSHPFVKKEEDECGYVHNLHHPESQSTWKVAGKIGNERDEQELCVDVEDVKMETVENLTSKGECMPDISMSGDDGVCNQSLECEDGFLRFPGLFNPKHDLCSEDEYDIVLRHKQRRWILPIGDEFCCPWCLYNFDSFHEFAIHSNTSHPRFFSTIVVKSYHHFQLHISLCEAPPIHGLVPEKMSKNEGDVFVYDGKDKRCTRITESNRNDPYSLSTLIDNPAERRRNLTANRYSRLDRPFFHWNNSTIRSDGPDFIQEKDCDDGDSGWKNEKNGITAFMRAWNLFMKKELVLSKTSMSSVCSHFLETWNVVVKSYRAEFLLHLRNLFHAQLLTKEELDDLLFTAALA